MFKALHSIIILVVGYNFKTALTVHNFHSQGSIPFRAAYHDVMGKYILNISFASYWVPMNTPTSRAAMWINCLSEGQKFWAIAGIEPRLSAWESSEHNNIPQHLHHECAIRLSIGTDLLVLITTMNWAGDATWTFQEHFLLSTGVHMKCW